MTVSIAIFGCSGGFDIAGLYGSIPTLASNTLGDILGIPIGESVAGTLAPHFAEVGLGASIQRVYLFLDYSSGSFFITSKIASMISVTSQASSSRSAIGALPKSIAPEASQHIHLLEVQLS